MNSYERIVFYMLIKHFIEMMHILILDFVLRDSIFC